MDIDLLILVLLGFGFLYVFYRQMRRNGHMEAAMTAMAMLNVKRITIVPDAAEIEAMRADLVARQMGDWTITRERLKAAHDDDSLALTVLAILASYDPQYVLDSPGGHLIVPRARLREIRAVLTS